MLASSQCSSASDGWFVFWRGRSFMVLLPFHWLRLYAHVSRHHAVFCVPVELSKEGDMREYYRHRMFLRHSCRKTRRILCLSPKSVPYRSLKRQTWSHHRTRKCLLSKNFANACEPLLSAQCVC